jgi:hypothetical protein
MDPPKVLIALHPLLLGLSHSVSKGQVLFLIDQLLRPLGTLQLNLLHKHPCSCCCCCCSNLLPFGQGPAWHAAVAADFEGSPTQRGFLLLLQALIC